MQSAEFENLRALSARLGSDPLLVQAAGGNTSLKQDGVMWIKASGTWLMDAASKDIFVPLNLATLGDALRRDDPACESCTDFVRQDLNPLGLRPSIETSVHGLMPQSVVLHVHCVNTIALAIRQDARQQLEQRLAGFKWAYVPYARPGLQLSRAINAALQPGTEVLVLENHGLAVAAENVAAAESLLHRVVDAVRAPARSLGEADMPALAKLAAGSDYVPASSARAHGFALDEWALSHAAHHVYYPDHVVFLGTEVPASLSRGAMAVAVLGAGVLLHKAAKPAVEPMLCCLTEVFARIPQGTALKKLTASEIDQLLNWDAEKYRQSLKMP